jgi:rhamnose transport system ATP-binding protein
MVPPLLELRDVHKSFAAVHALRGVSLELRAGEVHGLAGENGAGKSTVVRVIGGEHRPDAGVVLVDGEPVEFAGPRDARRHGIAVIHQEPTQFPDLTVAENVFMGRQPLRSFRRVDRATMNRRAAELFDSLGVPIDPGRVTRGLSIADQQIIEIGKALSAEARIIVMDEPTAALSTVEVERLFGVAARLAGSGAALLFISHRLEEMYEICARVTVLRDGALVTTAPMSSLDRDELVRSMVGRSVERLYPSRSAEPGAEALVVAGLTRSGVFADVSFSVRRGEVVGLAGLVGSGRSEVARAIFGVDPVDAGSVLVDGRPLRLGDPRAAIRAGVAMVPEDRREQGLVLDLSIERNATLPRLGAVSRWGLVSRRRERTTATTWADRLGVKRRALTDPVATLSGGNQQKVVLGKWLATEPAVLIVDEPTRGIDIGAKVEVHHLLSDLAASGIAVLMISSELPEVLGMADRILVMHEGRLTAELSKEEATEEKVLRAATGGEHSTKPDATEPSGPGSTEPGTTGPSGHGMAEPGATNPRGHSVAEPGTTNSHGHGIAEPGTTEPSEPGPAKPGATEPSGPGSAEPGTTGPSGHGIAQAGATEPSGQSSAEPDAADPSTTASSGAAPSTAKPRGAAPASTADPSGVTPSGATEPTLANRDPAEPSAQSSAAPDAADPSTTASSGAAPSSAEPPLVNRSSAQPDGAEPGVARPGAAGAAGVARRAGGGAP